jgi:hypothetical protein
MKYILEKLDNVDIILHTRDDYKFEQGKNYKEGDEIEIKEKVSSVTIVHPNLDMYGNLISYSKLILSEYEIECLLEKLKDINDKPTTLGKYSNLPF